MKSIIGAVLGCALCACGSESPVPSEPIDTVAQPLTSYLQNDIIFDCPDGGSKAIDSGGYTQHTIYMNAGDTLFVAGRVLAQYTPYEHNKGLVGTQLACGPTTTPTTDGNRTPSDPDGFARVQSSSGENHYWLENAEFTEATHHTQAIYTAEVDGDHTCWLIYSCYDIDSPDAPNGQTRILKDETYLWYYQLNQYPGTNFIREEGHPEEGDHLIDSTSTHTPGGSRIWTAGTSTQSDDEIVVYWSPRLTNCGPNDGQCDCIQGEPNCPPGGIDATGYNADTFFDWRIALYQYNNDLSNICNANYGTWTENVRCPQNHHHCDTKAYKAVFPIITGQGTHGSCGSSSAFRKFKVFAQIRKSSDAYSDIVAHEWSTGVSNIMIYSR